MRQWTRIAFIAAMVAGSVACGEKSAVEPAGGGHVAGEPAKAGALLAYEHSVTVELPRQQLMARMDALRKACSEERFGECTMLKSRFNNDESRPRATLVLRLVPAAVEPMTTLAAQDGRLGSRETRAEDVTQLVTDTDRQLAMLTAQRQQLLAFRDRKDLSVTDMIALSAELAAVQSRLAESDRTAADQRRRIETNLLTLDFTSPARVESRFERFSSSFTAIGDGLTDGAVEAVQLAGYGLPFLVLLFPVALLLRLLWRRFTGAGR